MAKFKPGDIVIANDSYPKAICRGTFKIKVIQYTNGSSFEGEVISTPDSTYPIGYINTNWYDKYYSLYYDGKMKVGDIVVNNKNFSLSTTIKFKVVSITDKKFTGILLSSTNPADVSYIGTHWDYEWKIRDFDILTRQSETYDWIDEELSKSKFKQGDLAVLNNDNYFVLFIIFDANGTNFTGTVLKSDNDSYPIGKQMVQTESLYDLVKGKLKVELS